PIYLAAGGPRAARLAGELADGLITTAPKHETVQAFEAAGGRGKPKYGQVTVCWAKSEESAKRTALKWWPTAAMKGELSQELPLPAHFELATQKVTEDDM